MWEQQYGGGGGGGGGGVNVLCTGGGYVSERHSNVIFKTMRQQGDGVHQWLDDHYYYILFIY